MHITLSDSYPLPASLTDSRRADLLFCFSILPVHISTDQWTVGETDGERAKSFIWINASIFPSFFGTVMDQQIDGRTSGRTDEQKDDRPKRYEAASNIIELGSP